MISSLSDTKPESKLYWRSVFKPPYPWFFSGIYISSKEIFFSLITKYSEFLEISTEFEKFSQWGEDLFLEWCRKNYPVFVVFYRENWFFLWFRSERGKKLHKKGEIFHSQKTTEGTTKPDHSRIVNLIIYEDVGNKVLRFPNNPYL